MPDRQIEAEAFSRLQEVVAILRSDKGCPWDRKQTPGTLKKYLIEECRELAEAIDSGNEDAVCEELGDVLFLLLFISRLYESAGAFSLEDALTSNAAKMIRRHPHVFSGEVFNSREEQLREWDRIKRSEKDEAGADKPKNVFDSLPRSLPPLTKAYRIHAKAAGANFTWDDDEDVERQVEAEWLELLDAITDGGKDGLERELGDMLFTLVELGRRKGIKAASALDGSCRRFLDRFTRMEEMARADGKEFAKVSMEEKNSLWDAVKAEEKSRPA